MLKQRYVFVFFILFVEVNALLTDKRVGTAHAQKPYTCLRMRRADSSHRNGVTSELSWKGLWDLASLL